MTLSLSDLALFAGALVILFLTPGPVWVALTARAVTAGFNGAWPLALGVAIGDVAWSFLAIMGVSWIVSVYGDFLTMLRFVAMAVFVAMGLLLLRHANRPITKDSRLTKPGLLAGFIAGLAVIIGNPKAILFYMGILPGFFDLSALTTPDIAAICALAAAVPLIGNLILGLFVGRIRALLQSPKAVRRTNITAGCALILVGLLRPVI